MRLFFTSDEHYEHHNIIKFCNRPFTDVDDMREGLIARHNEKVGPCDLTYHLGDMLWRTCSIDLTRDILKRLNGRHVYVLGNHEEAIKKVEVLFESVNEVLQVYPKGFGYDINQPIFLSHYAHRVWPDSHRGAYHLYGHTHNLLPDFRLSHDVGVDANNYYPISLEEVDALMKSKIAAGLTPDPIANDMKQNPWNKGVR